LLQSLHELRLLLACMLVGMLAACAGRSARDAVPADEPFVVVLGTGQDGGYPQAGTPPGAAWSDQRRTAASLGIVDPASGERWIVEATPDFREQLHQLDIIAPRRTFLLDGILLTHAHVGHYAGLIHLGREIMGARDVPVYAMPRMTEFLRTNGPWSQLVQLNNIALRPLADRAPVQLNPRISVTPLLVPHRDEYSETVGFIITGPRTRLLFLPDIDKWEKWDALGTRIEDVIGSVDVAYIDGTFYADGEVPGRSMAEIPHPFIAETIERITSPALRAKTRFIHLNRTNPAAFPESAEARAVIRAGFRIAQLHERVGL
jgi:pyrroloquinoline quinone biosynthesis protein B